MYPLRLGIIFLVPLLIVHAAAPSSFAQQRQRRVFTNEVSQKAAPPPAPAATPAAAPAEGTPAAEAAPSGFEDPKEDPNLPPGLSLSQFLQGTLRRFHTEFADRLEQETDPALQERLKTMMNLTMQLLAQNQLYIAEIQAQQPQQGEEQSPSQPQPSAGSQP